MLHETMPIPHEAARGLEQSGSWRWKFWKRTELNLAEAEHCLDRLDRMQPDPGQQAVLAMARAAAPPQANQAHRLAVMRQAMQTLTEEVSSQLCPLAGVALALRERSDPACPVDPGLAACLPSSGLLGEVAPDPGWLLEHAAQPYPQSASQWSNALTGTPPESVQKALDRLAPEPVQAFLREARSLGLESQAQLEQETLASYDQTLTAPQRAASFLGGEHRDEDVLKLGAWLAGRATPQPLSRLARELDHPEAYRTLARHLDQPEWLSPAITELSPQVPPRQLTRCLSELSPEESTLAWMTGIPRDEASRAALEAFAQGERSRPALLLSLPLAPSEKLALVDTDQPLFLALKAQTWPDEVSQARALVVGWKALEAEPSNLAGAGLAMARSTPDINEKLFLARATLQALGADELVALTRVEGPNQEWSQAALALAALRKLEQGAVPGAELQLGLVREASESWAGPPWRKAILEHLASQNPLFATLAADPDKLYLLSTDRLLGSVLSGVEPGSVAESEQAVIVGGVRVAKRGVEAAPSQMMAVEASAGSPEPVTVWQLEEPPRPGKKVEVTWFERLHRGVGAAYNPLTGEVVHHERLNRGVAAVFDPVQGEVRIEEGQRYRGVAGCFDPTRGEVHIAHAAGRLRTIAAAFDPVNRQVVERESNRNYGLALAVHPGTGKLEDKSGRQRGFGAVYHPDTGELEWHERRTRGVVGVSNDPEAPTLAGASYAPYEDDD